MNQPYNRAFFGFVTSTFRVLKRRYGEDEALARMGEIFADRLGPVYDKMKFKKDDVYDFRRCVEVNDQRLGLQVTFPEVTRDRIVYRFLTDPFPDLKGEVDPRRFDATYMSFKVSHLLGDDWEFETTRHMWDATWEEDETRFTEHVIRKKNPS